MGKEAKIGVAALGLLLIVLAGSVWWRFARWQRGDGESAAPAVAADRTASPARPPSPADEPASPMADAVPIRAVPLETAIRVPHRAGGWNSTGTSEAAGTLAAMPVADAAEPEAQADRALSSPLIVAVQDVEPLDTTAAPVGVASQPDSEPAVIAVQATEPIPATPPAAPYTQPQGVSDPFAARRAGGSRAMVADRPVTDEPAPLPTAAAQGWSTPVPQPSQGIAPQGAEPPRPSPIYQSRDGQPPPTSTYQRFGAESPAQTYPSVQPGVAPEPAAMMPVDPGAGGAVALRADGTYVVEPNDNYWRISEKFYGTGAYFKALAEHNRKQIARADRLQVGDVIEIPSDADLQANYGDLCPDPSHLSVGQNGAVPVSYTAGGRAYVVEEGDTLFDIARHELGSPARWKEIYDLNRGQLSADFNHLRPGTQLVLPADAAQPQPEGTLTRRPGSVY